MGVEVNVRHIRVFLVVADVLHFGRAAERLRISQPSVSQQVAKLERDLGCILFERTPSGVSLTSAGRDLASSVGVALRELDAAVDRFTDEHRARTQIRVGLLSSLTSAVVVEPVTALDLSRTQVGLTEGSLSVLLERLRAGALDVVLCYSTGEPEVFSGLQTDLLDQRRIVVALPLDAYPRGYPDGISWDQMAEQPWIMPSASRQYRDDIVQRFTSRGLKVSVVAEATTMAGQLALVAAGIGATFVSPWAQVIEGVVMPPIRGDSDVIELLAVRRSGDSTTESHLINELIEAVRVKAHRLR